jgi:shikimate dehydrogenase
MNSDVERLYVLGHPVAHSKSPVMHNAAYRALGLNWEYGFADRAEEGAALSFLDERSWLACNVTMPWKQLAFAQADLRSEEARLAGGANVLVNWRGRLHADNTDGKGCTSFLDRCGMSFQGARVSVCGTGPTALAIAHACIRAGVGHLCLLGRDRCRAQRCLDDYRDRLEAASDALLQAWCYDADGLAALESSDLIVDATPLGMNPGDPAPFDTGVLHPGQRVFDVVYGHGETALLAAARKAGCAAHDGAGMLVAQAVETVRDIAAVTALFEIPDTVDLFSLMSEAAGFEIAGPGAD